MLYLLVMLSLCCYATTTTTVESVTRLTAWITYHGGSVNEKRLEPFESVNGLGIRLKVCPECHANGQICPLATLGHRDPALGPDPLLLRVPYSLHMTPFSALHSEKTRDVIAQLQQQYSGVDYNSLLAVALALERRNISSQWRTYLDTLPETLPRFGSRIYGEELTLLYRMGNRHDLANLVEQRIEIDYASYQRIADVLDPGDAISLEEYLLATALVNSRAFGESPRHFPHMSPYDESHTDVAVLVPYLDLFNHAPDGTNRYSYEVIAEYDVYLNYFATVGHSRECYSPGEELFNIYHADDEWNIIHWLFYGFLVPSHYDSTVEDCDQVETLYQAIAQHFQFGPTPHTMTAFNTSQLHLLEGHDVLSELRLYDSEVSAMSTENPVMQSLIRETLSLTHSAIRIVERLQECRRTCIHHE